MASFLQNVDAAREVIITRYSSMIQGDFISSFPQLSFVRQTLRADDYDIEFPQVFTEFTTDTSRDLKVPATRIEKVDGVESDNKKVVLVGKLMYTNAFIVKLGESKYELPNIEAYNLTLQMRQASLAMGAYQAQELIPKGSAYSDGITRVLRTTGANTAVSAGEAASTSFYRGTFSSTETPSAVKSITRSDIRQVVDLILQDYKLSNSRAQVLAFCGPYAYTQLLKLYEDAGLININQEILRTGRIDILVDGVTFIRGANSPSYEADANDVLTGRTNVAKYLQKRVPEAKTAITERRQGGIFFIYGGNNQLQRSRVEIGYARNIDPFTFTTNRTLYLSSVAGNTHYYAKGAYCLAYAKGA